MRAFDFDVRVETVRKSVDTAVQSAFLKADTVSQLLVIEPAEPIGRDVPRGQLVKIKLEVDTAPPPGFATHTRYLLQPIPFAVRTYVLPDLFAGKMHAVLCRKWRNRVKGRDWYDFVWYAANHPELNLGHLESRMRQSGHWQGGEPLSGDAFKELLARTIDGLDVDQARREVAPFVKEPRALEVWSREFFHDVASRIKVVKDVIA